jgi:hypothetical protein
MVYKFLQIDNHYCISEQIYDWIINHTKILATTSPIFFNDVDVNSFMQHVPAFAEFAKSKDLKPVAMAVIVVDPTNQEFCDLHVDMLETQIRILWPVRNCKGSRTKFYKVNRESIIRKTLPNGIPYFYIDHTQPWPEVAEFELSQPLILDTSVPHRVFPAENTTEYRLSFTVAFDENLDISKSITAWDNV